MNISNQKISSSEITGLILAGGQGKRIDNRDKGLMTFKGTRLIDRQLDWFLPQVNEIIISANQNIPTYQSYGVNVVTDKRDGYLGPLAGIESGLSICKTNWLYVQAVDIPFLPKNLISQLCRSSTTTQLSKAYYLKTQVREHYLSLLIAKQCLQELVDFLDNKQLRVRDLLTLLNAQAIDLNIDEALFKNLNYSSDYID
ncbi:molybdenum cofactor guanylyltransferase [Aliikangiella sp. IMCC44359]|uniref:molybdenum cofactor guanylyltransferase n=1 Tax=Aliikangiella sp. IMCC44359 TaxID=3459125 RepID=UPI00403AA895